ncbi:MAG: hypothetical protein OEY11_14860 [Gammaproteobacteria bacterium]|nr:hypothetical protein [Gammaproteobacteria bacterium]
MIAVNRTNILVLTIPRTGTHFTNYFLFECEGRIVPVEYDDWIAGNNPISYTPDHCLVWQHFDNQTMTRVNAMLADDPDLRIVVPMRDLVDSFISAKLMRHDAFLPSLQSFIDNIDAILHYKFLIDGKKSKKKELEDLITYCGVIKSDKFAKYELWPDINSVRPLDTETEMNAVLIRNIYDDAKDKYLNGDINGLRGYVPEIDALINNETVKLKMKEFGYTKSDLSWL